MEQLENDLAGLTGSKSPVKVDVPEIDLLEHDKIDLYVDFVPYLNFIVQCTKQAFIVGDRMQFDLPSCEVIARYQGEKSPPPNDLMESLLSHANEIQGYHIDAHNKMMDSH